MKNKKAGYFHEDNDWSPIFAKHVDWRVLYLQFSWKNKGVYEEAASEEKKRARLFFLTN